MKHHTKEKGDLGVLKASLDLVEKGFLICLPFTEHSPFDLVVYKDSKFTRIQVKYRKLNNNTIDLRFRSVWADKNGSHAVKINKEEVDYFCVYCPDTDQCYYVNVHDYENSLLLSLNGKHKLENFTEFNP